MRYTRTRGPYAASPGGAPRLASKPASRQLASAAVRRGNCPGAMIFAGCRRSCGKRSFVSGRESHGDRPKRSQPRRAGEAADGVEAGPAFGYLAGWAKVERSGSHSTTPFLSPQLFHPAHYRYSLHRIHRLTFDQSINHHERSYQRIRFVSNYPARSSELIRSPRTARCRPFSSLTNGPLECHATGLGVEKNQG